MSKNIIRCYTILAAIMLTISLLAFVNLLLVYKIIADNPRKINDSITIWGVAELYFIIELIFVLGVCAIVCTLIKKLFAYSLNLESKIFFSLHKKDELIAQLQKKLDLQSSVINGLKHETECTIENDKLRTEFFSTISHELKTPISVILGAVQLIDRLPSNMDQTRADKHFNIIRQNCFRLLRLINNILDTTRLEKGFIKANLENSNIVYLIEEMTQSVIPYAQQKEQTLIFDTDIEEIITAVDIDKLERIMLNLLSNAIKFTPKGGNITVRLSKRGSNALISVKDTGPGIPQDMQQMVFERYLQINNNLTRNTGGSGIGLSLVKSFVEMHGGSVRIESTEGMGSEFIAAIPIRLVDSKPGEANKTTCEQNRIIQAVNIEFSDIYTKAS